MHSECYLLCSDIWSAFSPWGPDGVLRKKGGRGAKIQIVPRTSVGYEAGEYEKARKDRNTTAFEVEGWQKEEADRQEMIDWKQWPPKLVTNYPYGKLSFGLAPWSFVELTAVLCPRVSPGTGHWQVMVSPVELAFATCSLALTTWLFITAIHGTVLTQVVGKKTLQTSHFDTHLSTPLCAVHIITRSPTLSLAQSTA